MQASYSGGCGVGVVALYTTADGKALFSGVVWNLETGQNVTDSLMVPPSGNDPNFAARLPQVVAPETLFAHNQVAARKQRNIFEAYLVTFFAKSVTVYLAVSGCRDRNAL